MKFNLIPHENHQSYRNVRIQQKLFLATAIFVAMAVGLATASIVFSIRVEQQQTYYKERLQPVKNWIESHNTLCDQITVQTAGIRKNREKAAHWAPVLICLADSKPNGMEVQALHIRQKKLHLTAVTDKPETVREWQEKLRNRNMFSVVNVSKMNRKNPHQNTVDLELELNHGTAEPKKS